MVDVFHYFKKVIQGLGETAFGIIIPDDNKFVELMSKHPEFAFKEGRDFELEEDYCNLYESEVDGFAIVRVCCNGWVITFNRKISEESLKKLVDLEKRLNEKGYKCSIGVLNKTCSCT